MADGFQSASKNTKMDQYTLFVLLAPFACALTLAIAIYSWRYRSTPTALPLGFTTAAVAAYVFFNTLELVNPYPSGTLFFAQICYVCIGVLTISWMAFSLVFSNHEAWVKSVLFRLLVVIPALTIIMVFTNSYHHLIWKEYTFIPVSHGFLYMHVITYGALFWVFWIQAYLLIILSAVLTIWTCISQRNRYRERALLITFAMLLPLSVNLTYILHLVPGLYKDYSSIAYAGGGILLAMGIFHYQLLDLTPFARAVLVDKMSDAMLTLDNSKRLIDFNPAAMRIFSQSAHNPLKMVAPLPLLEPYLSQLDQQDESQELLKTEMSLDQAGEDKFYDLQIRRLRTKNGSEIVGYLVLMHAITEHKKLLHEMQKLAEEDSLTGVFNRNHFIEMAQHEIEANTTTLHYFSILMVDIDYFKRVNDSIGHMGGDQVLQAFAKRLKESLRSVDIIGRIGGDEFIILLPNTTAENARTLAERLCQQVADYPVRTKDHQDYPISISVGVSEYCEGKSESLEKVIIQADQALYQAKGLGRNRTCVYEPTLEARW